MLRRFGFSHLNPTLEHTELLASLTTLKNGAFLRTATSGTLASVYRRASPHGAVWLQVAAGARPRPMAPSVGADRAPRPPRSGSAHRGPAACVTRGGTHLCLLPVRGCGCVLQRYRVGSRMQPLLLLMSILARRQQACPSWLPFFISSHICRFFSTAMG